MIYNPLTALSQLVRLRHNFVAFRHNPVITSNKPRHNTRHNVMTNENTAKSAVFLFFETCQYGDIDKILQLPNDTPSTVKNALFSLLRTYHHNKAVSPNKIKGRIQTKDITAFYKKTFKKNVNGKYLKQAKNILIEKDFIYTDQPKKTIYYYWQSPRHINKILGLKVAIEEKSNIKQYLPSILDCGIVLIGSTTFYILNSGLEFIHALTPPDWYNNISSWLGYATPITISAFLYSLIIQYPKHQITLQKTALNMIGMAFSTTIIFSYAGYGGVVGNNVYDLVQLINNMLGFSVTNFMIAVAFIAHLHHAEQLGNPYKRLLSVIIKGMDNILSRLKPKQPYSDLSKQQKIQKMDNILSSFGLSEVKITEIIDTAPVLETYRITLPSGFKTKTLSVLQGEIQNNLGVESVAIQTKILGKERQATIQVPKAKRETVHLTTLLESTEFRDFKGDLKICFAVDVFGKPITLNLAKFPHLLIGAESGGGKSVMLNALLVSLLHANHSDHLKLTLIDPKRLELSLYKNIHHLACPVITEKSKAYDALKKVVVEMEQRYRLMEQQNVRNIAEYNAKKNTVNLRYHVVVIEEFGDLTATHKEISKLVELLAQKARACGIHLILVTQRPTSEVITGSIKDNLTVRIALRVQVNQQSRNILGQGGAEQLLGNGDGLARLPNSTQLQRIHGAYISTKDIQSFLKNIEDQKKQD